jgi:cytochrome c5
MIHIVKITSLVAALLPFSQVYAESERHRDGQQVYAASCASCHDTGAESAPSIHNPADWTDRSTLWEAVLFEHANKGYLEMPAKGGNNQLSEYDVDVAAEYILTVVHPELPRD